MVMMAVAAWRGDKVSQFIQKFRGFKQQGCLPIGCGPGENISETLSRPFQPLARENRSRAIADQPFKAWAVLSIDSNVCIERKSPMIPTQHIQCFIGVQNALSLKKFYHPPAHPFLNRLNISCGRIGLIKIANFIKNAVDDAAVEMKVRIQRFGGVIRVVLLH